MKLTIDTENKTIEIVEAINMKEFYDELNKTIPNWEEYSLIQTFCSAPVSYPTYPQPSYPTYPTYGKWDFTCLSNKG